jgi:hypothetical protein
LAGDPSVAGPGSRAAALVDAAIKKADWLDNHNPEIIRSLESR